MDLHYIYHNIQLKYNQISWTSNEYLPAGYSTQAGTGTNIHWIIYWIRQTVNEYSPACRMNPHYIYHNIQLKYNWISQTSNEYLPAGY